MNMILRSALILQVTLFTLINGYAINTLCTVDTDCPDTTATYCNRLSTVSPACEKGQCICRPGYIYDGTTACLQYNNLTLQQSCSSAVNDRYPWGAVCNNSQQMVLCQEPNYLPLTPTRCVQNIVSPIHNQACVVGSSLTNQTCNSTLNFACSSSTNLCVCSATTMLYDTGLSKCRSRIYGDTCSATADCDSGTYTDLVSASGGPSCSSGVCGCSSNFSLVLRQNYDTTVTTTLSICLRGHTANLTRNATCSLTPETESASGALVCSTSYACIKCPEDTTASNRGTCRTVLTTACSALQSSAIAGYSVSELASAIKACEGTSSGEQSIYFYQLGTLLISSIITVDIILKILIKTRISIL